jgi:hypothetical protein
MTPAPFHLESEVLQRAEELSLELGRRLTDLMYFWIQQNLLLAKQENGPI